MGIRSLVVSGQRATENEVSFLFALCGEPLFGS